MPSSCLAGLTCTTLRMVVSTEKIAAGMQNGTAFDGKQNDECFWQFCFVCCSLRASHTADIDITKYVLRTCTRTSNAIQKWRRTFCEHFYIRIIVIVIIVGVVVAIGAICDEIFVEIMLAGAINEQTYPDSGISLSSIIWSTNEIKCSAMQNTQNVIIGFIIRVFQSEITWINVYIANTDH